MDTRWHRSLVLIALALAAAACSGKTTDDPAPTGFDGAAGHGGTIAPPASQGAASITFATPDPPSTALCPVRHQATAPVLIAGSTTTTGISKGTEAIDGQNGDVVYCSVTPAPGGYDVTASIHSVNGTKFADIVINLTIAQAQSDAPGSLGIMDDTTQNAYLSPTTIPCMFSVVGASLGIGPGKIWASVTCPSLVDRSSAAGDQCKATGYFIFENCAR